MILTSITTAVSIQAPATKVFAFISNPANWPQWDTFFQPPTFSDDFFRQQISLVNRELAKLKEIMES